MFLRYFESMRQLLIRRDCLLMSCNSIIQSIYIACSVEFRTLTKEWVNHRLPLRYDVLKSHIMISSFHASCDSKCLWTSFMSTISASWRSCVAVSWLDHDDMNFRHVEWKHDIYSLRWDVHVRSQRSLWMKWYDYRFFAKKTNESNCKRECNVH